MSDPLPPSRLSGPHLAWAPDRLLRLAPEALEIQPTAGCHRTCTFCSHIVRNKMGGVLSASLVRGILDECDTHGVTRIAFSGGGEPLYWSEGAIAEMLAYASRFARVTLTSSGDQFLDRDRGELTELARACLPSLQAVILNVPGVDEASMRAQIVGGPSWLELRRLLELVVAYRAEHNLRPRIVCAVVVNASNVTDLPRIDRVLHDIGVDQVYFKEYKLFGRDGARRPRNKPDLRSAGSPQSGYEGSDGYRRFFASLASERLGGRTPCWTNQAGVGAIVDPNGEVFLCTPTVGATDMSIGNIREQSLLAMWTGERRRELVNALSARSARGACPIECRYHAHNRAMAAEVAAHHGHGYALAPTLVSNAGIDNLT